MVAPSHYCNETVAIATMHAKERAVARPFRRWLGADVVVATGIDTDSFGTFTGEIARRGTMFDAARTKAQAAADRAGVAFGLGSEGSFGPHPAAPFIAAGTEVLLFLDRQRDLEIRETLVTHRTNFGNRACRPGEDVEDFLRNVGFPTHAVVVAANVPMPGAKIAKGITSSSVLVDAIQRAATVSRDGFALIVTDMRAHLNPTRMATIRALASRMARRLATPCPACAAPGFGTVDVERGLPCRWCGEPTRLVSAELQRCTRCGFERRRAIRLREHGADPGQCLHCNP